MLRENAKVMGQLSQVLDLFAVSFGFVVSIFLYRYKQVIGAYIPFEYLFIFYAYLVIWMLCANFIGIYESRRLRSGRNEIMKLGKTHFFAASLSLIAINLFDPRFMHNRFFYYFVSLSIILTSLEHLVIRFSLSKIRKSGYNLRYCILIGGGSAANVCMQHIQRSRNLGYRVIGYLAPDKTDINTAYLGQFTELKTILENYVIDLIICTVPVTDGSIRDNYNLMNVMNKKVVFFTDIMSGESTRLHTVELDGLNMVSIEDKSRDGWHEIYKKLLDVSVSLAGLIITFPIFLGVAIAIKTTSKGPVFFVQERVGYNGRKFKMYKFRSMVQDAEELKVNLAKLNEMNGPVFKIKNDPRVTSVGKFLRMTSLDELPQLINVLRGDMSLVGPRPPLPNEVNMYDPQHRKRLSVQPGITCTWQISGRNNINFEQWMEMDADYVDRWSFWLDMKILVKTIPAVLGRRGAS